MKVDNKTNVALNQKRNTVRITTKDRFAVGSVWIADMLHVPFGVSLFVVSLAAVVVAVSERAASCLYGSPLYTQRARSTGNRHRDFRRGIFLQPSARLHFVLCIY